jgi:CelD/BcsL family acetyltransferase involved in cellulose biosynthesis
MVMIGVASGEQGARRMQIERVSLDEYVRLVRTNPMDYGGFGSPEMLESWWSSYAAGKRFLGLAATEDGRLTALLPLFLGAGVARFCGHGWANVVDFPTDRVNWTDLVPAVSGFLGRHSTAALWDIADVRGDTPLFEALSSHTNRSTPSYPCPIISIGGEWEETYRHALHDRFRRELKKARLQLATRGDLRHLMIDDQHFGLFSELFPQCVDLHRRRFADTYNTSGFSSPRGSGFHKRLLERLIPRGLAMLSCLMLGDRLLAFLFGVVHDRTFIGVVNAFDPEYADCSPGHVNLCFLMQYLNHEGFEHFDFSKGDSLYKRKWARDSVWQYHFTVPARLSGPGFGAISRLVMAKDYARKMGLTARAKRILGMAKRIGRSG